MKFWWQKDSKSEPEIGQFVTGDNDPTTGKQIIYICYQTDMFMVSIDSDINLNWSAKKEIIYAVDFGEISSQVGLTESTVDRIFPEKENRIAYKKILGDVIGNLLDEGKSPTAKKILDEVNVRVFEHGKERVRMAYISYAVGSVVIIGILVILTVIYREALLKCMNQVDIFRICVCTLLGGVGAFISTFSRFQNYNGRIIAGLPIHRLDGFLRVFYGLIAGIFISLAIKGKVIAGFADINGGQPWILYFFAMIAGASEALIPNLIKQSETQTNLTGNNQENTPPPPPPASPAIPNPEGSNSSIPSPRASDLEVENPVEPTAKADRETTNSNPIESPDPSIIPVDFPVIDPSISGSLEVKKDDEKIRGK